MTRKMLLLSCFFLCLLLGLPYSARATSGVYLSQLSSTDPRAEAGGTDPVFILVIQNGDQVLATVNADYTLPGSGLTAKVWSYALVPLDAAMSGTATLNDSFDVCDVTVRLTYQNNQWIADTLSSQNNPQAQNPLGIDCLDLYPLITREFIRVF